jgi:hypothetical protein
MRKSITLGGILFICLMMAATGAFADSWHLDDNYIGGDDHGYGDVISAAGEQNLFDIDWMDIDISDDQWLTVDIHTDFGLGETYGLDYGDLFFSVDGWHPSGEAPYVNDDSNTGEDWEYVFDVSSGTFYNIDHDAGQNAIQNSEDVMDWGRFRTGQEVLIDASQLDDEAIVSTGGEVYRSGESDEFYSMRFDVSELNMDMDDFSLAFHWAMTCGNDVIEGAIDPLPVAVPEPSTWLLLGMGVLGLGANHRKRRRR